MSESIRERTCNLDEIAAKLYRNEDVAETMDLLFCGSATGRFLIERCLKPAHSIAHEEVDSPGSEYREDEKGD